MANEKWHPYIAAEQTQNERVNQISSKAQSAQSTENWKTENIPYEPLIEVKIAHQLVISAIWNI